MHAFIGIWRRQADGRSNLVQSAGFYPKGSNKADAIYGPGEVATIDKASPSDRVFVAQINEEQTRRVGWVVKNWKDKTYVLGIQDCVSMVMDVAVSIGLKVGTPFPEDVVLPTDIAIPLTEFPVITPDRLIDKLSELNKSETPLLHAASKSGDIHIKQRNDQARVAQRVKVAAERERRYPKARGSEATPTLPIGTWEIETFDARMTQEIK